MKIKTMLLVAALTLVSLTAGFSLTAGAQNKGTGISTRPTRPNPNLIQLQCRNYGGQQDVAKDPDIINSTNQTLPAGKKLYWKASDGDGGSVVLSQPMAPGAKVGVTGSPGQNYTCTAWTTK